MLADKDLANSNCGKQRFNPASVVEITVRDDEAINTLFELGSKDTELRGEVFEAETDGANPKNLEISEHPVPKAEDPTEPTDTLENQGDTPT